MSSIPFQIIGAKPQKVKIINESNIEVNGRRLPIAYLNRKAKELIKELITNEDNLENKLCFLIIKTDDDGIPLPLREISLREFLWALSYIQKKVKSAKAKSANVVAKVSSSTMTAIFTAILHDSEWFIFCDEEDEIHKIKDRIIITRI